MEKASPDTETEPKASSSNGLSPKRTYGIVAGLFALIGVIASSAQIYDFFTIKDPNLYQEIKLSNSYLPDEAIIGQDIAEQTIFNVYFEDTVAKFCEKVNFDSSGTRSRNYSYDDDSCAKTRSLKQKLEKLYNLNRSDASKLSITLQNNGGDVASNIRFKPNAEGKLRIIDGVGKEIVSQTVTVNTTLDLPDLNPSEKLNITLETSSSTYNSYNPIYPETSFSKGTAENGIYGMVSPAYVKLSNTFSDMPTIIIIIMILSISFVVTFSFALFIAVIDAIFKGKPVSSVFATKQ